jgi:hypothetical protein
MATYIHKHGPETGSINLKDFELGITSDSVYLYTSVSGTLRRVKCGYADDAGTINGILPGSLFLKDGQDQGVADTNVTFAGVLTVNQKVVSPIFDGVATQAKYADIAENFEADQNYESGTVLYYGEQTEVSIFGDIYCGIVSDKPGYLLNSSPKFEYIVPVALKGRVPVLIGEKAQRGDIIVADRKNPGYAKIGTREDIGTEDFIGICINPTINGKCEVKV